MEDAVPDMHSLKNLIRKWMSVSLLAVHRYVFACLQEPGKRGLASRKAVVKGVSTHSSILTLNPLLRK